jgi:hypothetical protein
MVEDVGRMEKICELSSGLSRWSGGGGGGRRSEDGRRFIHLHTGDSHTHLPLITLQINIVLVFK